jgi:hypothetical protein
LPEWKVGTGSPIYKQGDEVQSGGKRYKAKIAIWDESAGFEPGKGSNWAERWEEVGTCS